jgi:hypothetical protein
MISSAQSCYQRVRGIAPAREAVIPELSLVTYVGDGSAISDQLFTRQEFAEHAEVAWDSTHSEPLLGRQTQVVAVVDV